MNRRRVLTIAATSIAGLALLAENASAQQPSDIDAIKITINRFHAALSSLDMKKMERVWAFDNYVSLINPRDKSISLGWDAVKKNWESTFNFWSELKVTQTDGPHIQVRGRVAWATGISNAVGKSKTGDTVSAATYETDIFVKRINRWLLVSHTASRVPQ